MLRPLALPLFPSCRNAISWSADGELAVAVGDHFMIMTPRKNTDTNTDNSDPDWTTTRVRANLFTNAEWPAFLPGDRDDFSIAGEQSTADIIDLAWSPPGLGKYRRCVLSVLTSNMVLSLWEPLGLKMQWTRVGVVNQVFWPQLEHPQDPNHHGYRKTNIRTFTWCDSPMAAKPGTASNTSASETRWGASLLLVANDLNEISLIQLNRSTPTDGLSRSYDIRILGTHALRNQDRQNDLVCSGSLLERALKERQRTSSLSCGPWISSNAGMTGGSNETVATVAAVCGTQLRLIKLEALYTYSTQNNMQQCNLSAKLEEHPLELLNEKWAHNHVTGPLGWLHTESSPTMALAVGIMAGLITITMSRATYNASDSNPDDIQFREWPIYEPEDVDDPDRKARHLEPISSMLAVTKEAGNVCKLQLGTLGGVGLVAELNQIQSENDLTQPQWKRMLDDFQEQFELDHDLGGMCVSRVWGLATYRDITAAIFTHHPTDMVEYRVSSDDVTMLVFSEEFGRIADTRAAFYPRGPGGHSSELDRIRELIDFVLPGADGDVGPDEESHQLIYVTACRAIVGESDKSLRAHARSSLERLAIVTGADLTEEMSKCDSPPSAIAAKPASHVEGPGGHVYEKCDVCDGGLGWCSIQQAQCANGHIWLRCGVSSLAIQEPGVSKYCSFCHTEALDEESLAAARGRPLSQTVRGFFETFDTCLRCSGKFQPNY